jgi:hypothetical protein
MRRVEDLHDQRDRGGSRPDEVPRDGRLGEAGVPARQHGSQPLAGGAGQPRPPRPLWRAVDVAVPINLPVVVEAPHVMR